MGSAPVHEHRRRGRDAGRVLVLNATFEPINVCSVRRAAVLLLKEKAEMLEHDGAGAWKTSVVFAGAGDAQPGWLVRCLSEFAFRGVNLTKIESRPRRGRLGHYLFHVDMEGRVDEPSVADAVQALDAHCEEVRLLGTYPAA